MKETDWFGVTTHPVREGAYKTRHRGWAGDIIEGYSFFNGKWGPTRDAPPTAGKYDSPQQSKEWKGLTSEY